MKKVLLKISYDGTAYAGWQRQKNALTVQEVVEQALSELIQREVSLFSASRTDAGVHALAQFASFEDSSSIPAEKFAFALNTMLPADVRILRSLEVPLAFNPRYDVVNKTYTYRIYNAPHASALYRNLAYHVPNPLDIATMNRAAALLIGEHDFTAFEAVGGKTKSKVRNIFKSAFYHEQDFLLYCIQGNGFLYNMVRIIVGTLIDIGRNKLPADIIEQAFLNPDRRFLGHTVPPQGLVLSEIIYPNKSIR